MALHSEAPGIVAELCCLPAPAAAAAAVDANLAWPPEAFFPRSHKNAATCDIEEKPHVTINNSRAKAKAGRAWSAVGAKNMVKVNWGGGSPWPQGLWSAGSQKGTNGGDR